MIDVLTTPLLSGTRHGFLGRRGGVSTGIVAGLNCGIGSGDDPASVIENRRLACEAVAPGTMLVAPYQTHSSICLTVTEPWHDDARPEADALVTNRRGIALSVLTADCAPVLLADADAGVVGVAHAGWKGAFGGVLQATVAAMRVIGAKRISAAIGPCIAQKSYEVGEDFIERAWGAANRDYFESRYLWKPRRTRQFFFDLEAYVFDTLVDCDLGGSVDALSEDTYSQPDRYFSFRRATHGGEPDYGRQISLIALP